MIEAKNICKYYGSFIAVENISFQIPDCQIVAFLGPNGAGKSTTMKILSGYLGASSGTAAIAGLDTSKDRLVMSKKLGYLPENGPLYQNMTPLELLHFFGEARGLNSSQINNRLEYVVQQCDLAVVLEKPIDKLSRGNKQRVGLAQALLHDPDVLIMDEPTAGLDPNQIRDFRQNVRLLGQTKTILLSTHILQEVEAIADRVLLINAGSLVFDGTTNEITQGSSLEDAFFSLTNDKQAIAKKKSALHNEGDDK